MPTALPLAVLACQSPGTTLPTDGRHSAGTETSSSTTTSGVPTAETGPLPSGGPLVFDGPAPRNLVVISIDTFRRDHWGRWDPEHRGLTPFLDGLLETSVVAEDTTACSDWTVASTTCVLSGASLVDRADARGMVPILTNNNVVQQPIPPSPGLAGWLGAQGYSSLLVSANDWMSGRWDAAQHFDRMDDLPGATATAVWERAKTRIAEQPLEPPYYLHLHLFEPHRPWTAPAAYLAELDTLPDPGVPLDTGAQQDQALARLNTYPPPQQDAIVLNMKARYRGEVRWLDDQLSTIWAELDASGMLDDTLVLLWTDHGEALWETGFTGHAWYLAPNENDAVAAFWARNLPATSVVAPVEAIDLTPTILSTFGIALPEEVSGQLLGARSADGVRTAFSDAFGGPIHSARKGPYLMQFSWRAANPILLHDVLADPTTQQNLYDPAAPSSIARELWAAMRPEILEVEPYVATDPRGYDLVLPPELEAP